MKTFVLSLLLSAIMTCTALPTVDSIIPEVEAFQTETSNDAAKDAKDTVMTMIQAGKTEDACAELADDTIKEVEDGVATQQKLLDDFAGQDCEKEGEEEVATSKQTLDNAQKAADDADKAVEDCENTPVQFPPKPFGGLTPGQCDTFFSDPAYTSVAEACAKTKEEAEEAKGGLKGATDAADAAEETQKKLVNACYCRVRAGYEKAWATANAMNPENAAAYTKGKHMQCVLAGTPPAECQVGTIPAVTQVPLSPGVESAKCPAPACNALDHLINAKTKFGQWCYELPKAVAGGCSAYYAQGDDNPNVNFCADRAENDEKTTCTTKAKLDCTPQPAGTGSGLASQA